MSAKSQGATAPKYQPCDGRAVICPTLSDRLQDGHSKGLNLSRIMNMQTGEEKDPLIYYKTSASDKGVVLNFCPFCGKKLNRRYRKPRKALATPELAK